MLSNGNNVFSFILQFFISSSEITAFDKSQSDKFPSKYSKSSLIS